MFSLRGPGFDSLVGELRSHKLCSKAKEKKEIQTTMCNLGLPWWLSGKEPACQ